MVILNHAFQKQKGLCCRQVVPSTTFKSSITLKIYQIFHQLNCKSSYTIFSLECLKCQLQFVEKSETEFNIRLSNHKKCVTRKDSIPASNHFDIEGHKFNIHAKFILIEQLNQTNLDKFPLPKRLKIRKNYWILKQELLHPKDLNRELNKT